MTYNNELMGWANWRWRWCWWAL